MSAGVVVSVITAAVVVVALLSRSAVRVVKQYERGVHFRLGRVIAVREPGLRLIIPMIDRLWRVSLRIVTMPIQSQGIITRDNVSVDIAAVAYFRVVDARKSVVAIENVAAAIDQIAQTTLRNVVGQHSLDEVLAETSMINGSIREILDTTTLEWGVEVTLVELKDIQLPDSMKRAMAREAEAEREKRAKIIAAEGEARAAAALGDASDTMMRHPLALQLRNLQTLAELGVEKNTTVVFPAPLMSAIGELAAFLARESKRPQRNRRRGADRTVGNSDDGRIGAPRRTPLRIDDAATRHLPYGGRHDRSGHSADTISTEQLTAIVELACRAPSLHNSQPWRWVFDARTLHLFADHARVGHHTDTTGREVILSCGAVAGSSPGGRRRRWLAGHRRKVSQSARSRPSSVGRLSPGGVVGEHERLLAEAISRRRTDRLAFAAPEPWAELEQRLRTDAPWHRRPPRRDRRRRTDPHSPMHHDAARNTVLATHPIDMNCFGGQVFRHRRWRSVERDTLRRRGVAGRCRPRLPHLWKR